MAAAQKIELPDDFLEAAKGEGLRKSVLEIYFKLQVLLVLFNLHVRTLACKKHDQYGHLNVGKTAYKDL